MSDTMMVLAAGVALSLAVASLVVLVQISSHLNTIAQQLACLVMK